MDNTQFSNSFKFQDYHFEKYRYADRRSGAEYHFIACLREGNCRIVSHQGTLELSAGDIFYIPRNLSYESYWSGSDTIRFTSFGFTFFPNTEQRIFPLQKIPGDAEYLACIDRILQDGNSSDAIFRFYSLLSQLLPKMTHVSGEPRPQLLSMAEHYLQNHPFAQIRDVANHCNISESGLYAAFKRLSNHTPNDLRQRILVDKAIALLEKTDIPVEEICSSLHFSSASYFRKVLKKHTGLTPSQIRKQASF
jgi:AraC-like DNA-binding protein